MQSLATVAIERNGDVETNCVAKSDIADAIDAACPCRLGQLFLNQCPEAILHHYAAWLGWRYSHHIVAGMELRYVSILSAGPISTPNVVLVCCYDYGGWPSQSIVWPEAGDLYRWKVSLHAPMRIASGEISELSQHGQA